MLVVGRMRMRRLARGAQRFVWGGASASPAARAYRLSAALCLIAAIALLGFAVETAFNPGPAQKKLARGVVFDQPLAAQSAIVTPAEPYGPPLPASPAPETATATPASASPSPEPAPQSAWVVEPAPATPAPSQAGIVRLKIPAIKVDAPISVKGVDSHGTMEDPTSWYDVVWYNFSGRPGFGGGNNAVF